MKINIRVIPKAKLNKIEKIADNDYKVWMTTAPVDGKANQVLIKLLSKFFEIKKSQIEIVSGNKNRNKIINLDL